MINYRRQIWLYPLFQVPLMLMVACLIIAALGWFLSWGRPPVAVTIALDFSSSTAGIVRQQEIQAVNSYLEQNQELNNPNQVQIFGFASQIKPLTTDFQADTSQVKNQLKQSIQNPNLERELGGGTNLNLAIKAGTDALSGVEKRCRELLIVSDGEANVDEQIINSAIDNNVKINAVVLGGRNSPAVKTATNRTEGIYLQDEASNLERLFTDTLFTKFNSNNRWMQFWLAVAFIFLMWMLVLPLDRWVLQGIIGLNMTFSGQIALGNALFWTVLTLTLIWRLWGLPFGASC
ncbi:MAG: VWA domain-containing protein [Microcoleaceae cyanobacterium MO_207.B10]|nr:VWA domain-containing protein [Microcoleaceae cyanobacterium MO_207.B10]